VFNPAAVLFVLKTAPRKLAEEIVFISNSLCCYANLPKASTIPKQSKNTSKRDVLLQLISVVLFLQNIFQMQGCTRANKSIYQK